jgi:hypothetical protein
MFDDAMMRSLIAANVPYPALPGLVTGANSLAERVGTVLCRALNGAEQIASIPTRLGFRRLSWPDTAPHPFA